MTRRGAGLLPTIVRLILLYTLTGVGGFALFVLCFETGLLPGIDILFYRGLVLVVLAFVATFALAALVVARCSRESLGPRDAFAAAILSLAFNIVFLVVVPVTVDRSISIFVLGRMAAQPRTAFTAPEMSKIFTDVYVGERDQIARRLHEQAISGNVEKVGDGYRITPRGALVITASRFVARLFDSRAGLLPPAAPATTSTPDR